MKRLFLLLNLFAAPAFAQDPYTVSHVVVEEASRPAAMDAAGRQAFSLLIYQMTNTPPEQVKLPSDAELGAMIQDFEIDEEKLSATHYKATMTVRFQPQAIENYLGVSKPEIVPEVAEIKDQTILLVPLVSSQNEASFWEERSDFWQSWERFQSPNAHIKLKMPEGDISDISQIRLSQIRDGDQAALSQWAQHYGATGVIVAERFMDQIKLTYHPIQGLASQEAVPIQLKTPAEIFPTIETLLSQNPQDTLAPEQTLFVILHPKSLPEWIDFKDILNQISQIKSQKILSFELDKIKLELAMQLSTEQFAKILSRYHLRLDPTDQPQEWDIVDAASE